MGDCRASAGQTFSQEGAVTGGSADVYYGTQSLHEFLERSTWHSAQHTRQLALVVEKLGLTPDRPLGAAELAGLPLPDHAWDDKLAFA